MIRTNVERYILLKIVASGYKMILHSRANRVFKGVPFFTFCTKENSKTVECEKGTYTPSTPNITKLFRGYV